MDTKLIRLQKNADALTGRKKIRNAKFMAVLCIAAVVLAISVGLSFAIDAIIQLFKSGD